MVMPPGILKLKHFIDDLIQFALPDCDHIVKRMINSGDTDLTNLKIIIRKLKDFDGKDVYRIELNDIGIMFSFESSVESLADSIREAVYNYFSPEYLKEIKQKADAIRQEDIDPGEKKKSWEINSMSQEGVILLLIATEQNEAVREFMAAAAQGDLKTVRQALNSGIDVNVKTLENFTALIIAIMEGYMKTASYLITKGADVNVKGPLGNTPLIHAVLRSNYEMVNTLIENGADINCQNKDGETPLLLAARGHYPDLRLIEYLMENGADLKLKNKKGESFQMRIAQSGRKEIFQKLFDKGLLDFNGAAEDGKNLLMYAANGPESNYQTDIIKTIIKQGIDVNDADHYGDTAIIFAAQNCNVDAIRMLIENGADVNAQNNEGKTALMEAVSAWHDRNATVSLLLSSCSNVNLKDKTGKTALMFASMEDQVGSEKQDIQIIKNLIESGADVNARDNEGFTALLHAVYGMGMIDTIEVLIKNNADVNVRDIYGDTALIWAARKANYMIQPLLSLGANADIKNNDGKTAAMFMNSESENISITNS